MKTTHNNQAKGSRFAPAPCQAALTSNANLLAHSVLLFVSCWLFAAPTTAQNTVNEQNLTDAILGSQAFTQTELDELDMNFDGRVDVADLVFFLSGTQFPLEGYQWLVSANFGPDAGEQVGLTYSYEFAVTVASTGAIVSPLKEFNPTKDLLRQKLSGPGEVPGALRTDYSPTALVPIGTGFSVSPSSEGFLLTSDPIQIAAGDSTNPTNNNLTRRLILTVSTAAAFSAAAEHGTIIDELSGFAPSGAVASSTGTVRLTRYAPNDLSVLEGPTQ